MKFENIIVSLFILLISYITTTLTITGNSIELNRVILIFITFLFNLLMVYSIQKRSKEVRE